MENNKKNINIIMIGGMLFLLVIFLFKPICLFKKIFHIPCPTCGMTRAFLYITKGDIFSAVKMNLLSIPLFICIIIFIMFYFFNVLFNKNYIYKLFDYLVIHYKLLIVIFLINWIINIVKNMYY